MEGYTEIPEGCIDLHVLTPEKRELLEMLAADDVAVYSKESELGTIYTVERLVFDQGRDDGSDPMGQIGSAR